jgi:predicted nucleotidyltransferase
MIDGMATAVPLDPVLKDFREAVAKLYGPTLDRVVLFGSRARGEARGDSDYDVAVFLNEMPDRWAEWDRMTRLAIPFMDEGAYIQVVPFRASDFEKRTPIMHEIRKDGLTL